MPKESSDQDVTALRGTGTVHIWNDQETWGAHWDHDGPKESGQQLESVDLGADVDDLVVWGRERSRQVLVYGMDGHLYWVALRSPAGSSPSDAGGSRQLDCLETGGEEEHADDGARWRRLGACI